MGNIASILHFLGMAQERIQSKTRQYLQNMNEIYHVSCISLHFESHDLTDDVMNKFWLLRAASGLHVSLYYKD